MFTGVIRARGVVVSLRRALSPRLVLRVAGLRARVGDSVAVDGVCLTVARRAGLPAGQAGARLTFDLLAETLRATTLGRRRPGDRVNLEPALRLGDPVGGHWVLGHVDGVGRLVRRRPTAAGLAVVIAAPPSLRRYLAPKGAIAVDGVSLTLGPRRPGRTFTVFLIPQTVAATTLARKQPGDLVNLEADPIARYVVDAAR